MDYSNFYDIECPFYWFYCLAQWVCVYAMDVLVEQDQDECEDEGEQDGQVQVGLGDWGEGQFCADQVVEYQFQDNIQQDADCCCRQPVVDVTNFD